MGPIGVQEMIGIFLIALLLFGPKKLPELGRTLGKALSEFRRAKNELKSTFESHLHELERETRVDLGPMRLDSGPDYSSSRYSNPYESGSTYGESSPSSCNAPPASTYETPSTGGYASSSSSTYASSRDAYGSTANVYESSSSPYTSSSTPYEGAMGKAAESVTTPAPSLAVEGTVARSNGTQPVTPVPAATGEDHRA
ncbi:MAG: twin-arginine translocase TatA/TatE family subunit [Acidobacteriaceae bacterium]|nr:twin-arginine translocase TatA/TatE family subunit [Acidobacteriaceae bacterium]